MHAYYRIVNVISISLHKYISFSSNSFCHVLLQYESMTFLLRNKACNALVSWHIENMDKSSAFRRWKIYSQRKLKIENKSREQKIENRIEKRDYKLLKPWTIILIKRAQTVHYINKSCLLIFDRFNTLSLIQRNIQTMQKSICHTISYKKTTKFIYKKIEITHHFSHLIWNIII